MTEPWNEKVDDERLQDTKSLFIIFCEDGEIEPAYFGTFESNPKIKISIIGNYGQHHRQVDKATTYCRNNALLETIEGKERLKLDEGAQVWCVFDRDKEEGDEKDRSEEHTSELQSLRHL